MSRATTKQFLTADLAETERLLQGATGFLERSGLRARAAEIRAKLDALPSEIGKSAEVVLSFSGDPVVGSSGIETRFATEVLGSFQHLVSAVAARRSRGELNSTGPLPDAKDSRLHVSNVVHGSFGFQLSELDRVLVGPTDLAVAVEQSVAVIAAAKEGDEAFGAAIEAEGERIREATLAFLDALRKRGAAVRLISDKHDVRLDRGDVGTATAVVKSISVEETEESLEGIFGGVLLESGRFEHKVLSTGKVIDGKLDPALKAMTLVRFAGKPSIAHLRVVRTMKGDRERRREYVLLGLDPAGAAFSKT